MAAGGSALFLVVAPGVVAGLVPWLLTGWHGRYPPFWTLVRVLGVLVIAAGVLVLSRSFVRFVVEGAGTPSPLAPTERLVVGGFYRYVRNPLYVAVVATVIGQFFYLGRPVLLAYAAGLSALFAGFVHWYEEPALMRRFGSQYEAYSNAVPAWRPSLHPWEPNQQG